MPDKCDCGVALFAGQLSQWSRDFAAGVSCNKRIYLDGTSSTIIACGERGNCDVYSEADSHPER